MARHVEQSPLVTESIIESEEMQRVLGIKDYDEEKAFKLAIERSLGSGSKAGERGTEEASSQGSSGNCSGSGSSTTAASRAHNRVHMGTMEDKRQTLKNGGNRGQMLIDPWLSVEVTAEAHEDYRHSRESSSNRNRSRRTSFGRSRFDYEPMVLISTSATPDLLREETPGYRFTSPKKQAADVIEVACSDPEDVEIDHIQAHRRILLRDNGDEKGKEKAVFSSAGTPNRRRLARANASLSSVNVISSEDEETNKKPTTPVGRRKFTKEIPESSDEEFDELTRDSGKNAFKPDVHLFRNTPHPIAVDTIPRSIQSSETPTKSSAAEPKSVGGPAKIPCSITDGPDRNIVLSTPTSKQRIRKYNMVIDSEDNLSEAEKSPSGKWSATRRRNSAHAKHLGLPAVEAVEIEWMDSPLRTIVSDSETELGVSDTTPTELDGTFIITESTVSELDTEKTYDIGYQDASEQPRRRHRASIKGPSRKRTLANLTKPRPLVLNLDSDDDFEQNVSMGLRSKDGAGTKKEHKILQKTLILSDNEVEPAPTPEQSRRWNLDREKEQQEFEKSPFASFPIFNRIARRAAKDDMERKSKEEEMKSHPIWKGNKEAVGKRQHGEALVGGHLEAEEDEPLMDSRPRRRSNRGNLASPHKKMRLSEAAPGVSAIELALKAAADHTRQQAEVKDLLAPRMEAIESFPSVIDSQPVITRAHSGSDDMISHMEEIEDFSDEQRTQQSQKGIHQDERRTRRYSGLHLLSRGQPKEPFMSTGNDILVQQDAQQEWQLPSKKSAYQSQDYEAEVEVQDQREYSICDISPTLSQYTTDTDKCPICRRMIPINELIAHVETELLSNEQKEREDMQKRDQALAKALDESYQTQDVVIIRDSLSQHGSLTQAPLHLTLQQQSQPSSAGRQSRRASRTPVRANTGRDDPVSLDTPTRKVSHLTLDSPSSMDREQGGQRGTGLSNGTAILNSDSNLSHPLESETIDLSDIGSLSSQSAFQIQPGQIIKDITLDTSDVYISTRPIGRKTDIQKTSSGTAIKKTESGHLSTPFLIQDEMMDDDMDDFFDKPEPASMLNRSFRTSSGKASGGAATDPRGVSTRRKVTSKKSIKAIVELYDSEDDNNRDLGENSVVETKRGKAIRKGAKLKSAVLDGILPASARQRRQELLKKSRGEHKSGIVDDDDEIEVGRRHRVTERLWNQEDDLLESEHLDRRQVKGVGLGGIVGGIGALPGSLAMSKITKNITVSLASAGETVDATDTTDQATLKGTVRADRDARSGLAEDNEMLGVSASLEFEDPNYGMQSQEWWDTVQAKNPERPGTLIDAGDDVKSAGGEVEGDNDGYMSPLDDFVDLRERRDDPALAMYFAQFGMANGDVNSSGSTVSAASKGRSRGRGRTRGAASSTTKKSASYARGVGPMSTTMSASGDSNTSRSTCEQTVLTSYEIPRRASTSDPRARTAVDNRYGARNVSFGGHATTANGSMAIRSKPTEPFVPRGTSRGRRSRGGGSSRSYWRGQGRGRGRGRGGG